MSKVKISREVAGIIERCKEQGTTEEMVAIVAQKDPLGYERYEPVMRVNLQTIMSALVNGYEVEQEPTRAIREMFDDYHGIDDFDNGVR